MQPKSKKVQIYIYIVRNGPTTLPKKNHLKIWKYKLEI